MIRPYAMSRRPTIASSLAGQQSVIGLKHRAIMAGPIRILLLRRRCSFPCLLSARLQCAECIPGPRASGNESGSALLPLGLNESPGWIHASPRFLNNGGLLPVTEAAIAPVTENSLMQALDNRLKIFPAGGEGVLSQRIFY